MDADVNGFIKRYHLIVLHVTFYGVIYKIQAVLYSLSILTYIYEIFCQPQRVSISFTGAHLSQLLLQGVVLLENIYYQIMV